MTEPVLDHVLENGGRAPESVAKARWPLSYCLQPPKPTQPSLQTYGIESNKRPPRRWWSYKLYRGPEGKEVQILYSRDKVQSEAIAQHFINEPILGFDMEWPWNDWKRDDLQNKIGLIQVASEDKIGLFHIGLHPGKTTDDIIAPTLRRIIESPEIGKVGVSILHADFGRLARYFGLKPKGAIESSHLYRLVKFGPKKPELVSVKLVSLATQVEDQLGLPLYKGDVRTSNWSKPLSQEQINYSASDAYAGFTLYHCTNAKRLAMHPVPPPPIYAERYGEGQDSKDHPILLDAGDGTTITTGTFFGIKPAKSGPSNGENKALKIAEAAKRDKANVPVLDAISQALFDELITRRAIIAERTNIQAYRILSDTLLAGLAKERPSDTSGLLSVKGIGSVQVQKYGDAWLEVISLFSSKNGIDRSSTTTKSSTAKSPKKAPQPSLLQAPRTPRRRHQASTNSSPAFEAPPPRTPPLHTGLSFTLAETNLEEADAASAGDSTSYDSDVSLQSVDFGSYSHHKSSAQKRKRTESPSKDGPYTTIQRLQQRTNNTENTPIDIKAINTNPSTRSASLSTPKAHSANPTDDNSTAPPAIPLTTPLRPSPKPTDLTNPQPQPQPQAAAPSRGPTTPLSTESRIARNKLLAFSKLVTRKLPNRRAAAPPIVTEHTLDLIVRRAPRTQEELERIPGVDGLLLACETTGTECLRNVVKFVGRS